MSVEREFMLNAKKIAEDRVNKVMRATGLEAQSRIMDRTPVDKGRARANWNASKNAEDGYVDPEATLADVQTKTRNNEATIRGADFLKGDALYISNGIPYIGKLEDGSSTQAPAGMVSLTMSEIGAFCEKVADDLGRRDR